MSKYKTKLPCLACGSNPCDLDHITTRGAGGKDTETNMWPLCRSCHSLRHLKGLVHMFTTFPDCRRWLEDHGRDDILERKAAYTKKKGGAA